MSSSINSNSNVSKETQNKDDIEEDEYFDVDEFDDEYDIGIEDDDTNNKENGKDRNKK